MIAIPLRDKEDRSRGLHRLCDLLDDPLEEQRDVLGAQRIEHDVERPGKTAVHTGELAHEPVSLPLGKLAGIELVSNEDAGLFRNTHSFGAYGELDGGSVGARAGERRGTAVRSKGKGREREGGVWQRDNPRREERAYIQPSKASTTREEPVRNIVCHKDTPGSVKDKHGVTR